MPLSKQEILEHKRNYYNENRVAIRAKNLNRYHIRQAAKYGDMPRPTGRPRLVFPEEVPEPTPEPPVPEPAV